MKVTTLCFIYLIYLAVKLLFFNGISENYPNSLKLEFFDVGQGDSILISSITNGARKVLLIDGGEGYDVDFLIDKRFPITNCHLNTLLLSHPHSDHLSGLYRIIQRCKIDEVISNPAPNAEGTLFNNWQDILKNQNTMHGHENDSFHMGDVFIKVLWPIEGKVYSDINDYSIVLFLDYHDFEALFLGDINKESLEDIDFESLKKYVNGSLDVIKVSHHGSRKGLYKPLFDLYSFDYAVISVGENNDYNHPHSEVLDFLASQDIKVLRTDVEGTVEMVYNSK